jgi:mRNA-degrading endonuclease HigB of HigAB toxin-antitoxin module
MFVDNAVIFSVEGSDLKLWSMWNIKIMKCFALTRMNESTYY